MRFNSPFANQRFDHSQPDSVGVLYCNLGTPDAATAQAVRPYLAEFLSDPRVVEIPRLIWLMILHGIILRLRPAKSAAKYASIWLPEGSPLKVWTMRQAEHLQRQLNALALHVQVRMAMRYGQPSVASQLDDLMAQGARRILVLSAYPQYSGTTTASVIDAVNSWSSRQRWVPELRFVNQYHDHPAYIAALAAQVRSYWATHGQGDKLLMSFHGVPERTLHLGDPYHCQCYKTARLLAEALQLDKSQYQVSFQSRFGKAKWLEPATDKTLQALATQGVGRVDVFCPGFVADCLETLEEIAMEGREIFLHAGGQDFHCIPCLNDSPAWQQGLAEITAQHLQGWDCGPAEAQVLQARKERALALSSKS
jgi:protoporphyrin/coproporphyrin ferrochelatase